MGPTHLPEAEGPKWYIISYPPLYLLTSNYWLPIGRWQLYVLDIHLVLACSQTLTLVRVCIYTSYEVYVNYIHSSSANENPGIQGQQVQRGINTGIMDFFQTKKSCSNATR